MLPLVVGKTHSNGSSNFGNDQSAEETNRWRRVDDNEVAIPLVTPCFLEAEP